VTGPATTIRRAADFEREIGSLIELAGYRTLPVRTGGVDFLFEDAQGQRTAVAIKLAARSFTTRELVFAFDSAQQLDALVLHLVTSDRPSVVQRAAMSNLAERFPIRADWLTREEFATRLEISSPQREVVHQVGLAAALIRAAPTGEQDSRVQAIALRGRLPQTALDRLGAVPLSEFLRIGEEIRDVTFVMSDIKNYSTIVAKARPRDLQTFMTDFYRHTREAIRSHGGTLIDFAGDGALAVFDYPFTETGAPTRALLCASDLIEVGRAALAGLLDTINADIETGIRIGIANGDVLIVDSGLEQPEPQFVSDSINLAARLQALAPTNGMLMDKRTHVQLEAGDPQLLEMLNAQVTRLAADEVKGQLVATVAWAVDEPDARAVADSHSH